LSDIADGLLEKKDVVANLAPKFAETASRGAALLAALSGGPPTRK
jgi:hypothetical protein